MSAETLREAAALMRERAEAVTDERGTWFKAATLPELTHDIIDAPEAVFIESWHPDVALAVADWLNNEGRVLEIQNAHDGLDHAEDFGHALNIADAYLGEEPP